MTNGAASDRIQRRLRNGAQERTRTSTAVKPLAPEASASTNSATWARWVAPPRAGLIGGSLGAVNRLFSDSGKNCTVDQKLREIRALSGQPDHHPRIGAFAPRAAEGRTGLAGVEEARLLQHAAGGGVVGEVAAIRARRFQRVEAQTRAPSSASVA